MAYRHEEGGSEPHPEVVGEELRGLDFLLRACGDAGVPFAWAHGGLHNGIDDISVPVPDTIEGIEE